MKGGQCHQLPHRAAVKRDEWIQAKPGLVGSSKCWLLDCPVFSVKETSHHTRSPHLCNPLTYARHINTQLNTHIYNTHTTNTHRTQHTRHTHTRVHTTQPSVVLQSALGGVSGLQNQIPAHTHSRCSVLFPTGCHCDIRQCRNKAIYQPLMPTALRAECSLPILFHKLLCNRVFSTTVWCSSAELCSQIDMGSSPDMTTYWLCDWGQAVQLLSRWQHSHFMNEGTKNQKGQTGTRQVSCYYL